MRLFLVDVTLPMVTAWERAFADFKEVTVMSGDILAVAENTIVSPANSYGIMDGGIDRQYRDFFGERIQRVVHDMISHRPEGYLPVGASFTVRTEHARIPYLIVAPTMIMPEAVPASHVYRAMRAVLRAAKREPRLVTDVYCPGLASGVGQVEPDIVADEMASAYRDWQTAQQSENTAGGTNNPTGRTGRADS